MTYGYCLYHKIECDCKGNCIDCSYNTEEDKEVKLLTSVLDEIRAEIEKLNYLSIEDGSDGYDKYIDRYDVLQIINKYRVESEK